MNQNQSNTGSTSASRNRCTHCEKEVKGGTYIQGVFYCPMCTSIINKNNQYIPNKPYAPTNPNAYDMGGYFKGVPVPDCCIGCSNHPSSGGSGVCHCTIPHMSGKGPKVTGHTSTHSTGSIPMGIVITGNGPINLSDFLEELLNDE